MEWSSSSDSSCVGAVGVVSIGGKKVRDADMLSTGRSKGEVNGEEAKRGRKFTCSPKREEVKTNNICKLLKCPSLQLKLTFLPLFIIFPKLNKISKYYSELKLFQFSY